MNLGYARVSTDDQHLELQLDALRQAGCEKIFEDKISGSKFNRPGLNDALAYARKGDVLVVWRLDRLGRSLPELLALVAQAGRKGYRFAQPERTNPHRQLYRQAGVPYLCHAGRV